jgi:hypothetical protein
MFYHNFRRNLPLMNFSISSTALFFQITVLNPWHSKISSDVKMLKTTIEKRN